MDDQPVHANHRVQHRYPREVKFCALCGAEMESRVVLPDRKRLPVCPRCGFVFFSSPKLVVGCLVVERGRVLLIRRGIEPALGKWTFPGGFVEFNETAAVAAARESLEEVGLAVRLGAVLGVYTDPANSNTQVITYLAETSGSPATSAEATEVRYFALNEIPWGELAFRSTHDALTDWVTSVRAR
ncbi:MAG TPA: NUDIX hydrolase [Candidatus Binataceae bacterium]|nr:NUDIX hydrolase [Candidatus Binataceae bacterium]